MNSNDSNQSLNVVEAWVSKNALRVLLAAFCIAAVIATIAISLYLWKFSRKALPDDLSSWGQFGDFLGGTLNPVFAFLSVLALLATLILQSKELRISSEELRNSSAALKAQNRAIEQQRFEQTFFSWLASYRELLNSIELIDSEDAERRGRRALYRWWLNRIGENALWEKSLNQIPGADKREVWQFSGNSGKALRALPITSHEAVVRCALEAWEDLYSSQEYQLDSLFRTLYRLVYWIDSQPLDRVSIAQKWLYVSIVRAQISWIEMVYLFYNGYTMRGKNFNRLIEKYALFDNLTFDSDSGIGIVRKHTEGGGGFAASAFDSKIARSILRLPPDAESTLVLAAN